MNWFSDVVRAEADKIYGVQEEYLRDEREGKINLSVGVYRDENGLPFVPSSVRKSEELVLSKRLSKEYAPIEGFQDFRETVAKFIFGNESEIIKQERHATVQGIGGTGCIRIGAIFLRRFLSTTQRVYVPEQTWSAHIPVFADSGFEVRHYRYWNSTTMGLDFEGLVEDVSNMPAFSIVLFHSIAHNPTGVDPTIEQWQQILDLIKQKNLFVFFDCAYLGFASGSVEEDSEVINLFAQNMNQFMIAITFAKNMGIYGDRIGALSVVCQTQHQAINVVSQLKKIIRPIYSSPPNHGARIVTQLLNDCQLKTEWFTDVKNMVIRITTMRWKLIKELNQLSDGKYSWNFIANQRGMYCYSGLTEAQALQMREQFSIYIATDGRINVAAINEKNIKQIAYAINHIKQNS